MVRFTGEIEDVKCRVKPRAGNFQAGIIFCIVLILRCGIVGALNVRAKLLVGDFRMEVSFKNLLILQSFPEQIYYHRGGDLVRGSHYIWLCFLFGNIERRYAQYSFHPAKPSITPPTNIIGVLRRMCHFFLRACPIRNSPRVRTYRYCDQLNSYENLIYRTQSADQWRIYFNRQSRGALES